MELVIRYHSLLLPLPLPVLLTDLEASVVPEIVAHRLESTNQSRKSCKVKSIGFSD